MSCTLNNYLQTLFFSFRKLNDFLDMAKKIKKEEFFVYVKILY